MKTIKEILNILESAVANVQRNEKIINDLNVFPVPDGDTGSNMFATLFSGINEVKNNLDNITSEIDILKYFSRGTLYGARGNSGVITSQIMKGLYEGSKDLGLENKDVKLIKHILEEMSNYGYSSVPKPVEGTILSVIKYVANNFTLDSKSSIEIIDEVIKLSNIALQETPNQLPILKKSGVVDSGGKGLVVFFEGVKEYFLGNPLKLNSSESKQVSEFIKADPNKNIGYCSEFILTLKDYLNFEKDKFKVELEKFGDSIVLIQEEDILKVHIHAVKPGDLFNFAHKLGEFSKIKIENMTTQVSENSFAKQFEEDNSADLIKKSKLGLISVANGLGIEKIMKKQGVDIIINGGQTMNPSVNDFMTAIGSISNKEIVLLPNNSNIILAAEKAKELSKQQFPNKKIYVLNTKSIQQGLYALFNLSKDFLPFEDFQDALEEDLKDLKYGEITFASRDTDFDGVNIKEGNFISISNKKIIYSSKDLNENIISLLNNLVDSEDESLNIFYNNEVDQKTIRFIKKYVKENFSDVELKLKKGDQKVYFLIAFCE